MPFCYECVSRITRDRKCWNYVVCLWCREANLLKKVDVLVTQRERKKDLCDQLSTYQCSAETRDY